MLRTAAGGTCGAVASFHNTRDRRRIKFVDGEANILKVRVTFVLGLTLFSLTNSWYPLWIYAFYRDIFNILCYYSMLFQVIHTQKEKSKLKGQIQLFDFWWTDCVYPCSENSSDHFLRNVT